MSVASSALNVARAAPRDRSQLRVVRRGGGAAWDAKIRRQIASCALYIPVISAGTQERLEGYFRLE